MVTSSFNKRVHDAAANRMTVNRLSVRDGVISTSGSHSSSSQNNRSNNVIRLQTEANSVFSSNNMSDFQVGIGPLSVSGSHHLFIQEAATVGSMGPALGASYSGFVKVNVTDEDGIGVVRYIQLFTDITLPEE